MITMDQIITAIKALVGDNPFTNENVERALTDEATRRLRGDRANSLDWRHSIVDLLTILDLDSSWEARVALAKALGYDGELTKENSFNMNFWLLRTIFNEFPPSDS
jgi:hypothetical protein